MFPGKMAWPMTTPYSNAAHGTVEDNYNFFHSSLRISVECCFGEVDLRFRIFWQPPQFSLEVNCKIINACLCLYNFILENSKNHFMDSIAKEIFDEDCWQFFSIYPDIPEGVHGGKLGARVGGCPNRLEFNSVSVGKSWHDLVQNAIHWQELSQPRSNWYQDNNL
jgi:hypothetical protein